MRVVFVPRETELEESQNGSSTQTDPGENRVAATPTSVKTLIKRGFRVVMESGAGQRSSFTDDAYREAGAEISKDPSSAYFMADIVLKFHPPRYRKDLNLDEASKLRPGALLLSFLWPVQDIVMVQRLASAQVTAFAMDQVPRISRAQSMDALTSQSNIAGYKAVLMAANTLPKLFPLMMTASGTIKPAKVVILGAGVAGLQATATAKRLGAIVEVSDIRPAVKEQVESLGGRFIEIEMDPGMEDSGGYAKEVSAGFLKRQQALVREHMANADVVITTALVPGKKPPLLVPEETVKAMNPGSVIVDIAAGELGGNCALSEYGKEVVKHNVTIMAPKNLPATQPVDASNMYANNLLAVLRHLYPKDELVLDFEDPITQGSIVTFNGEILHEGAKQQLSPSQRKRANTKPPASRSPEQMTPAPSTNPTKKD